MGAADPLDGGGFVERSITLSALFFQSAEKSRFFVDNTGALFVDFARRNPDCACSLILRNNAPDVETRGLDQRVSALKAAAPANCAVSFERSTHNLGFGGGHNANFALAPSALFFVVNDDIVLENLDFLDEIVGLFEAEADLCAVGAVGAPGRIRAASVAVPPKSFPPTLTDYLEASIIVYRGEAFARVGGFSSAFGYAYYEDGDLCLRLIEAGYQVQAITIDHTHFRGSSAATLPAQVVLAEHEHNRATFHARWNGYLRTDAPPGIGVIDLRADGVGDVVYAMRPVIDFLETVSATQVSVILNGLRCAYLFDGLPVRLIDGRRLDVMAEAGLRRSATSFWCDCRTLVHPAPFLSQNLIYAALGIQAGTGDGAAFERWRKALGQRLRTPTVDALLEGPGGYAVLHVDSQRGNFQGRSPKPAAFAALAARMAARQPVVLIGQPSTDTEAEEAVRRMIDAHGLIDLRDTSLETMTGLIANASRYAGIDSGPMHIAQMFGIESAIVFGATLPSTKVVDRANTQPIVNAALDCIGCYHKLISSGYAFCMRRDEACMVGLDPEAVAEQADAFFATRRADWHAADTAARRVETGWLRLLLHHPHLRSDLVRSGAGGVKRTMDVVTGLNEDAYDRAEQTLVTLVTALEKRLAQETLVQRELQADVKRLMQERSVLTHALMGAGRPVAAFDADRPASRPVPSGKLTRIDLMTHRAVACSAKNGTLSREDNGLVLKGGDNPQLIFAMDLENRIGTRDFVLFLTLHVADKGLAEIYFTYDGTPFVKERRIAKKLASGENTIDAVIPQDEPVRRIRIDIIMENCEATISAASILAVADSVEAQPASQAS